MSILKVDNIRDNGTGFNDVVSFQNANSTENGRLCRAFVNFDGTGVVAIRTNFNVNSITDNSTGNYTVNLTNALSDANYAVIGMPGHNVSVGNGHRCIMCGSDVTSSSCRIMPGYPGAPTSGNDDPIVCVAFFR